MIPTHTTRPNASEPVAPLPRFQQYLAAANQAAREILIAEGLLGWRGDTRAEFLAAVLRLADDFSAPDDRMEAEEAEEVVPIAAHHAQLEAAKMIGFALGRQLHAVDFGGDLR